MTESINLGERNLQAGTVHATQATVTVEQAPANRQNNSVTGTSLPESNVQQPEQQSAEQIENTVANLNDYVQSVHRDIHFSTHESTGRTVITVTDGETGEEIRKIPSEELLAISAHLAESLEQLQDEPESGLLFDVHI